MEWDFKLHQYARMAFGVAVRELNQKSVPQFETGRFSYGLMKALQNAGELEISFMQ
jgi:hypothetical protein